MPERIIKYTQLQRVLVDKTTEKRLGVIASRMGIRKPELLRIMIREGIVKYGRVKAEEEVEQ